VFPPFFERVLVGRLCRPTRDALPALCLGASVVVFFVRLRELRELRDFVVSV